MKLHKQVMGPVLTIISLFLLRPAFLAAQEQQNATADKQMAQYVGSDTCKTCHEAVYEKSFANTPHFKTTLGSGDGCESCHGPGQAHVEGGGDVTKIVSFKNLSRQETNARCLSCHGTSQKQRHFSNSSHASNDVGCLDCHSPHHAKAPQYLLAQKQPEQCYSCHTNACKFLSQETAPLLEP